MTKIRQLLKEMIDKEASDLFYRAGGTTRFRIDGKVVVVDTVLLSVDDVMMAVEDLATSLQRDAFRKHGDVDFSLYLEELKYRFRVDIFMQRNWPSIVIRRIKGATQTFEELNLPAETIRKLCQEPRGLVLLTGTMGSGKSTTIASMIEYINCTMQKHVLTIEEPIEFTFEDKKSIVNQREIGADVASYPVALRTLTLQSPDVIFLGNIRDAETMSAAITAAETGALVLSTLHTVNAVQSIERMINFFPPHQQQETKNQLSGLLKGVLSLRLIPSKDKKGRLPAYETMLLTPTISRLIREGKLWEIPHFLEEGGIFGLQSFNQSLVKLVKEGKISEEEAGNFADNKEEFDLCLQGIKRT
ncbi:MAG: PilT/PilU family type 4a pilus ATPase [Candidatus Omnitrophica bacterium]|nr:PilT/PilU family type 4a pilus ATPase [Candidatus Omnitrophota bacterium]